MRFVIVLATLCNGLLCPDSLTAQSGALDRAPDVALQQAAVVRLSLADALRRGLESSHRIAELRAREDATQAAVGNRQASARPQISALAGYTRTNHVDDFGILLPTGQFHLIYPDVPDNYRSRLDLQWLIFNGGRTQAMVRAATADAEAASRDTAAARSDLRLEITRAYWALVTAEEAMQVVQAAVTRVSAHVKDVTNRLDVGLGTPSDLFSVQAQESRQRLLVIEATNARAVAAADLRRLIGLAPETALELDEKLEGEPAVFAPIEGLLSEARRTRPERQALDRRIAAATARQAVAETGRQPMVAIAAGIDYARPNPRIFPRTREWSSSWDASANFSWSLWDGGRTVADIAEADANVRAVKARREEFDAVLDVEVRQRRLDLEAARAAVTAASDGLRSAAEARRVIAERFGVGLATSTDLLDAQVALLQADLDRTRALANVRLAEARLERALGR